MISDNRADLPSHSDILAGVAHYRKLARERPRASEIIQPTANQISVWSFPRPPEIRSVERTLRVSWAGEIIGKTASALSVIETAGAPVYFFPPYDVRQDLLVKTAHVTLCEWKGAAVHFDLTLENRRATHAAFCYPDPLTDLGQGYERIAGWYAFYPARVDRCFVGDDEVTPQPGGYYAGWVTPQVTGPFKGGAGTKKW